MTSDRHAPEAIRVARAGFITARVANRFDAFAGSEPPVQARSPPAGKGSRRFAPTRSLALAHCERFENLIDPFQEFTLFSIGRDAHSYPALRQQDVPKDAFGRLVEVDEASAITQLELAGVALLESRVSTKRSE